MWVVAPKPPKAAPRASVLGLSSASDQPGCSEWARNVELKNYLPGTNIPVNGWFQPCTKCRDLTAHTRKTAEGEEEVPMCRRCSCPDGRRRRISPSSPSGASTSTAASSDLEAEEPGAVLNLPITDIASAMKAAKFSVVSPSFSPSASPTDVLSWRDEHSVSILSTSNSDVADSPSSSNCSVVENVPLKPAAAVSASTKGMSDVPGIVDSILADFLSDNPPFSWSCWPCLSSVHIIPGVLQKNQGFRCHGVVA